ncbi:hypothetical protein ACEQ8H_008302 [Pleosporales sp. CAS-2024a]
MSLQPEPHVHPVTRVKAPWPLKAETYVLFLRMKELPARVYDPLEQVWEGEDHGQFKGGLGAVMIVRYSDTPVGPYDELMLIPGNFTVPQPSTGAPKIPKEALRIARIYVSQRTTTYNGRLNWNIPKHLARFTFSAPPTQHNTRPPQALDVRVFPPGTSHGDAVSPFFSCTLTPWRWIPAIPVNTAYVPIKMLSVQPPCPEAPGQQAAALFEAELKTPIDAYDVGEKNEEAVLVGTERWCATNFEAQSRARGCWVKMHTGEEVVKEGKHWPQGLKPWSVGVWMEGAEFEFGKPIEWKL